MNSNLKVFQKLPLGLNQKQWIDSKNLEEGKERSQKENLSMKHRDRIQKAT
jgi:hypothetical protein